MAKTETVTGTLSVAGQTLPYGTSGTNYVDSTYLPLGNDAGDEYVVVTASNIPQTARVNDTGTLYTGTRYPSSDKRFVIGTVNASYVLQPDTGSTAILKVIVIDKTSSGATEGTSISSFRITPAGALTPLTEDYQEGRTSLNLRY